MTFHRNSSVSLELVAISRLHFSIFVFVCLPLCSLWVALDILVLIRDLNCDYVAAENASLGFEPRASNLSLKLAILLIRRLRLRLLTLLAVLTILDLNSHTTRLLGRSFSFFSISGLALGSRFGFSSARLLGSLGSGFLV